MKTYILSLMAIMIVLSACKKDAVNKSVTNGKTTPVTFSVGYTQSTGSFHGAVNITKFEAHTLAVDTTLAKSASVIYVGVYTTNGTQLFLTKQLSTDTVFGKVSFNLPQGDYIVTFAAGQTGMAEGGTNLNNTNITYGQQDGGTFVDRWQSTFFKKINLTVGATGIDQSVTLNRIDSQLVVNIEDAIPSNVKFVALRLVDPYQGNFPVFSVSTASPGVATSDLTRVVTTSSTTPLVAGTKNLQLAIAILDTSHPHVLEIFAFDQLGSSHPSTDQNDALSMNGTLIGYYINSNVTFQVGHQTILSGKLFGGNGTTNTGGFQMTIDPEWSPTTTTIPFQ